MGGAEFILNIAMVALLSATVFYCWVLNRRIKVLQDSRGELANLLKKFDLSTKRAAQTMNVLQKASKEAGKSVQSRIEKAQYILDDLSYMIDRANKLADQMEAGIAIARQREKIDVKGPAVLPSAKKPMKATSPRELVTQGFEETSVSEIATEAVAYSDEMIELKNTVPKLQKQSSLQEEEITRDTILQSLRQAKAGGKGSQSAISSLQSLIERVAERTQDQDTAHPPIDARTATASAASRSERELMRALEMQAE